MTEQEILKKVDEVIAAGPFKDNWDSLLQAKVPEWFTQRRFGIFVHWGLYSVPEAISEWYSRNMYIQGMDDFEHHVATYGPHKDFGYKDFIPMFTAEGFDPKEWVRLFKEAGAGYIFPVAEHHDGFQMYDSDLSEFTTVKMGPHRDIIGEVKAAAEEAGLVFCASNHRAEHWFFMGHGKEFDSDIKEPLKKGDFYWPAMPEQNHQDVFSEPYPTAEYLDDWLARNAEFVLKYKPKLVYFDWWLQHQAFKPYLKKFAAFYYNCGKEWGEDVMICYKHDAFGFGTGIVEVERGGFAEAKPYAWQTDTAVARNSWCYTNTLDYKSSEEIIWTLIDVIAKGGNLLLNIGPRADGSIPVGDRQILEDLAAWMKVNSGALIGSRCWRRSQEGPTVGADGQFSDQQAKTFTSEDYRFTCKGSGIYAFALKCPEDGNFLVKSLAFSKDQNDLTFHGIIENVEILGFDGAVKEWKVDHDGLHIKAEGVKSSFPVVIKATME